MTGFLLHLQGPMMSFADKGFGQLREEGEFPSRSVALGILAAAMGLERGSERLLELHRELQVHVASLRRGSLLVDYHTILTSGYDNHDPARLRREGAKGNPTLTWRSYHTDAHFMTFIESDNTNLLDEARQALTAPVYTSFIGRRSCPPSIPLLPVDVQSKKLDEIFIGETREWISRIKGDRQEIPYHIRRNLSDHLDVWIDKGDAINGIKPLRTSFRRDLLTALPRSYVNRPVIHGRIQLPDDLRFNTNERYFHGAY